MGKIKEEILFSFFILQQYQKRNETNIRNIIKSNPHECFFFIISYSRGTTRYAWKGSILPYSQGSEKVYPFLLASFEDILPFEVLRKKQTFALLLYRLNIKFREK